MFFAFVLQVYKEKKFTIEIEYGRKSIKIIYGCKSIKIIISQTTSLSNFTNMIDETIIKVLVMPFPKCGLPFLSV